MFLIWFCLASSVEGMSHKIERSFKLIFWGAELGVLKVKAEISDDKYSISTIGSGKSIINFFSRFRISSGAVGEVTANGNLIPTQSITRWNAKGKSNETRLSYINGKLIDFDSSSELKKPYHIKNPIGIENTVDTVSFILWLLLERSEAQLCTDKLIILDGFRMSELVFANKRTENGSIVCIGNFNRIAGFKKLEKTGKPLKFKIIYSQEQNKSFEISIVEIETIFGKIFVR